MTNLREAAQMALDALEHGLPIIEDFGGKEQLQLQHKAIAVLYEALRAALEQPEQEPQETIAKWIKANTEHKQWYICPKCSHQTPRWKDEWVGLTDEEIKDTLEAAGMDTWFSYRHAARAIEAKLKEKNT